MSVDLQHSYQGRNPGHFRHHSDPRTLRRVLTAYPMTSVSRNTQRLR